MSNSYQFAVSSLYADLLWLEYEDTADEAREAFYLGDKLKALALAMLAYKIKQRYMNACDSLIFS